MYLWGWGARRLRAMKAKKFYVEPQAEVVELKVQGQILAGSGEGEGTGEGGEGAPEFNW